ncbi:hypothetical protein CW304_20685 [Bacillus sp. UFRGS-B20]|nr:hypothetical protein CW304_20685 [Bacillus sp. UFRGS-B20]
MELSPLTKKDSSIENHFHLRYLLSGANLWLLIWVGTRNQKPFRSQVFVLERRAFFCWFFSQTSKHFRVETPMYHSLPLTAERGLKHCTLRTVKTIVRATNLVQNRLELSAYLAPLFRN